MWRVDSRALQLGAGEADGRLSIGPEPSPLAPAPQLLLCYAACPPWGTGYSFHWKGIKNLQPLILTGGQQFTGAPAPDGPPGVSPYPAELVTHLFTSPGLSGEIPCTSLFPMGTEGCHTLDC